MRLIDADAFSEKYGNYYAEEGPAEGFIGTVGELIAKQPTIESEPVRHGRWVELPKSCQADYECSECGAGIGTIKPPYCAFCGARMDGGEQE